MLIRMNSFGLVGLFALALLMGACTKVNEDSNTAQSGKIEAGKYTILDTRTDLVDMSRAKQNAEDAIIKYPEMDCMVGLWAYNPPAILSAVKDVGLQGKMHIVGFDEDDETLQGIIDSHVHGTVVQQPFKFGYEAVRILKSLAEGDRSVLPEDGKMEIPARVIKENNVQEFWQELKGLIEQGKNAPPPPDGEIHLGFLSNNTADFWSIANAGVNKAMADFGVKVEFLKPPNGSPAEQQRFVESLLAKEVDGISLCPIDPENQTELINTAAEHTNVICHDSDAPESDRLCYVGTNNYRAGRKVGELVKEVLPDGGEVMIFVGRLDQLNAIERRQGVIDELAGKPMPEEG